MLFIILLLSLVAHPATAAREKFRDLELVSQSSKAENRHWKPFERIFRPNEKRDEFGNDVKEVLEDEPVRTKGPYGISAFPPAWAHKPLGHAHGHGHVLGHALDPLFILLTLSFVFFLVNSVLGLLDHGKLPIHARLEDDLYFVERSLDEGKDRYGDP